MHFSSPSHVLYTPILLLILIHLISQLMVGAEYNHEAPRYVLFSSFLSLSPYEAVISLSAANSWTPWACFPPIMWETKFHIHNKQLYMPVYINLYILKQQILRRKILDWMVAAGISYMNLLWCWITAIQETGTLDTCSTTWQSDICCNLPKHYYVY